MTYYTTTQPWKTALSLAVLVLLALTPSLLAAEAGTDAGVEKETMWTLIQKGGPIMIPLGIASIIALALAIERFISLKRDKVLPDGFLKGFGQAWDSDPSGQAAEQFCEQNAGSAGHVFKAGLQWRDAGHEAVAKAIEMTDEQETLIIVTADHECGDLHITQTGSAGQWPTVRWGRKDHTGIHGRARSDSWADCFCNGQIRQADSVMCTS